MTTIATAIAEPAGLRLTRSGKALASAVAFFCELSGFRVSGVREGKGSTTSPEGRLTTKQDLNEKPVKIPKIVSSGLPQEFVLQ